MCTKLNAAQLQYNTIQYNTSFTHASERGTMGRGTTREPILPIVPRALSVFPFPNLLARSLCAGKKRVIDSVACWLKLRQRNLAGFSCHGNASIILDNSQMGSETMRIKVRMVNYTSL